MDSETIVGTPTLSLRELAAYFSGIASVFVFALLSMFALMRSAEGVYWNDTSQIVGAWMDKKMELAQEVASPKIILLGGSNVFYGLRADVLQETAAMPVFNFGVHGALPLSFYLFKLREFAKPGDTVLFAPELNYYFRDPKQVNQESLRYLFPRQQDFLMAGGSVFLMETLFRTPPDFFFAGFLHPAESWRSHAETQMRNASSIMSKLGDYQINRLEMLGSSPQEFCARQTSVQEFDAGKTADYLVGRAEKCFFPFLVEFRDWAASNHITLVFTWPNTRLFPVYENQENREFFRRFQNRVESLGIPVVASPYDSMLPADRFFDTIYHLHQEAAVARTKALAEQWKLVGEQHAFEK